MEATFHSRGGRFLSAWKVRSPGAALAVDGSGNVYVAQLLNQKISIGKFSPRGRLLARLGLGMHMGDLPTGMVIDRQGNLVVFAELVFDWVKGQPNDSGPHILKLSPSGKVMAFFRTPMSVGHGGLAMDGQGNLYMVDSYQGKVYKASPDGQVLTAFSYGQRSQPFPGQGIAVDRSGNMFVSDGVHAQIVMLSPAGAILRTIGVPGSNPGELMSPPTLRSTVADGW